MTSPIFRRIPLVAVAGLFALAPLVLFVGGAQASTYGQTTRKDAGTPNSTTVVKNSAGVVVKYGDKYITYSEPPKSLIKLGRGAVRRELRVVSRRGGERCAGEWHTRRLSRPGRLRTGDHRLLDRLGPHARQGHRRRRSPSSSAGADVHPSRSNLCLGQLARSELSRTFRRRT